jgi:hypothetical protein
MQTCLPPRIAAYAGGGSVVEKHMAKLGLIEEGGDEVAHAGDICIMPCTHVRQMQIASKKKKTKNRCTISIKKSLMQR